MATAQIPIADELDLNQLLQNLIAIKKGNFSFPFSAEFDS